MPNKIQQPQLLPEINGRLDIKSPIFKPRPGWGGQLKNWLSTHFQEKILPAISFAIFAIGLYLIIR